PALPPVSGFQRPCRSPALLRPASQWAILGRWSGQFAVGLRRSLTMTFVAVIVAAGTGSRAGGAKQWRLLGGRPVARWSLEAMLAAGAADVVVVIPAGSEAQAARAFAGLDRWRTVPGGADRAASVRNGLAALAVTGETPVLVHDAARPLLEPAHVRRLLDALPGWDGAILALPAADTLKRVEGERIAATASRDSLWR